ncbi:restriction endonuclease subunit S [Pediococcus damnosus]|uniref:restriction endonuclease subunit S n=1 Tax=Pediococcus damnosus TaxID=51663 RepID=UPI003F6C137E
MSNKVPQIRFNGYSDAWEDRKLSDMADRFDNLRVPITASDRKPGDTPYYGANGIQDYVEGFTHNGEFILVAEDGANDLKNYPVQYVNGKVWVNNHAHVLQGKKTITDNKFLMNAIKNFKIEPFLVGGGRAKLNADVMMKLNILLPTFVEQEKIGSLFSLLDKTITLHQRKLDLLKEQKKGYLQKMFPKNGAKVPELRFAGFADDWEERKLKDVVEKQIKGKAQFEKLAPGEVEYLDTSRLNGGQAILTNGLKDVTLDDILILWDGSKAGTVYHGFEGALGSTLKAYRTSANSKFVYQYLKRHQDNIYNNYRTPNIPHVQKDFLNVFTISVPVSDEQEKIASFFKQLDDTIALHQRKLDLLKEQKKGFLQNMFV